VGDASSQAGQIKPLPLTRNILSKGVCSVYEGLGSYSSQGTFHVSYEKACLTEPLSTCLNTMKKLEIGFGG